MPAHRFIDFDEVRQHFQGKHVAIVGSGPGSLDNEPGFVDSHEVVVRVNNYKTGDAQGRRCDVHYAFYGTSIKKQARDLMQDGVRMCMSKLPNDKPLESRWHEENNKLVGIDYRYIYKLRAGWWFTDTFIPDTQRFLRKFELLGRHQPTTGFAAILDVLECEPKSLYLTGFDFFTSGIHNVDEAWQDKNNDDPIRHRPDLEAAWIRENVTKYPMAFDKKLQQALAHG